MHYSEFKLFDRFITSALPRDRALLCGIRCCAITQPGEDPTKNPACITFSRENPNNPEDFTLRADPSGNVNIGSWVLRNDD